MNLRRFIALSLLCTAMAALATLLSHTDWADRVRARSRPAPSLVELRSQDQRSARRPHYASQLLKVFVFMSVPGAIALTVKKLAHLRPTVALL